MIDFNRSGGISEDNQELRLGCPPDYQNFFERIDPKIFIKTNISSNLSLTNKNSSMRTSITYIKQAAKLALARGQMPVTNLVKF